MAAEETGEKHLSDARAERLAHREEKYHQAIANEARQQASVDNVRPVPGGGGLRAVN